MNPEYPDAHGNTAWILATCPDPAVRDGAKAVEYALIEVKRVGRKNALYLDTLAAAYAENGDFEKAVSTQTKAVELAASEEDRMEFGERLELFKTGEPYRDE